MEQPAIGVITTLLVLIAPAHFAASYNILAIFPFSGKSHFHMFRAVSDALVARGHDVTVVSHFPKTKRPVDHWTGTYTDYSLVGTMPVYENFTTDEVTGSGYFNEFLVILQDGLDNCEKVISSGRIKDLIQSHNTRFDLVLVEVSHDSIALRFYNRRFLVNCLTGKASKHSPSSACLLSLPSINNLISIYHYIYINQLF